jgi:CubicO group peptidase (beta-lactamase class C family)
VAALLLIGALGADTRAQIGPEPIPWPTREWRTSSPTAQGLDDARLRELVALIADNEQFPDLHSLLVVRHGYLVVEEYFAGHDAGQLHPLQSVSKSFTSAAIGIAIAQGRLEGVREPVLGFFPDLTGIAHVDDRKRAMTLEDLLTMRSGTDYHERGPDSPHYRLNALSRGWTEFVLSRPMVAEPGTRFQYDSGGVILMSAILKSRTGMHADVWLEQHLFAPLGITSSSWYRNAEGHPHTGGGLGLRPRDMAKFGLLYLRRGRWDGRQVVPEVWVEASTARHHVFGGDSRPWIGYGYLWWILQPDPQGDGQTDIFAACGAHGQYIFVIPEHAMVVVVTGGTTNNENENAPIGFLYSHVLPAVER